MSATFTPRRALFPCPGCETLQTPVNRDRAVAKIEAVQQAISAFEGEYLPSGIRETPEWQTVLTSLAKARGETT